MKKGEKKTTPEPIKQVVIDFGEKRELGTNRRLLKRAQRYRAGNTPCLTFTKSGMEKK